jgi:hypothetical protein
MSEMISDDVFDPREMAASMVRNAIRRSRDRELAEVGAELPASRNSVMSFTERARRGGKARWKGKSARPEK